MPVDARDDPFCSGHDYLGTGQPITIGGLNRQMGGGLDAVPYGHGVACILRTDLALATGQLAWEEMVDVHLKRWYPTAEVLPSGDLIALGHTGDPLEDTPQGFVDPVKTTWMRDYLVVNEFAPDHSDWKAGILNRDADDACSDAADPLGKNLHHYPRTHVLTTGELMWVDEVLGPLQSGTGSTALRSQFLTIDESVTPDCTSASPGYTEQYPSLLHDNYTWRKGVQADGPDCGMGVALPYQHAGGASVHLITYEQTFPGNDERNYTDVIYLIGGTERGADDAACPCSTQMGMGATDEVKRMVVKPIVAPADSTPWDITRQYQCDPQNPVFDLYPPALKGPRANHNSVILLDGSMLVVGGVDDDPNSPDCDTPNRVAAGCIHRFHPERFEPPEIFDGVTKTSWKKMAPQTSKRQYHSVGGLLPDGRVFSAGGTYDAPNAVPPESDQQTVEIYSPPYCYQGPRPVIEEVPGGNEFGGAHSPNGLLELHVRTARTSAPERLALVKPSSVTHAWDSSQRYVELKVEQIAEDPLLADVWDVRITLPPTYFVTPPGWYLITCIDDQGRPSPGRWLFIEGP